MARGWESKSVEEQQAQASLPARPSQGPLSPEEIRKRSQKQGLVLSRQRVLHELETVQNPRHREMLQAALAELESKLAQLG